MAYKKPTLIELLAEFVFHPGTLGADKALAAAERIRKAGMPGIDFVTALAAVGDGTFETTQRIRCWSEDKKSLAQFGVDRIIANQVAPYGGWDGYVDHVRATLGAAGFPELSIASVSFQAIDRFEVPEAGFVLDKYFVCDGLYVPRSYEGCSTPCDITLGRGLVGSDRHNRQLKIQVTATPGARVVRIDSVFHDALGGDDALVALERLHDEANTLFEAVITDVTRNSVMEGRVP